MELIPKAKPVRIRIKSGGKEHFSLDSLKRNFSAQDLWEAAVGGSLSSWLKQQEETDLRGKLDAFLKQYQEAEGEEKAVAGKLSIKKYLEFSGLFFEKETGGHAFEDANALVQFYKDQKLKENLRSAFSFLADTIDYQIGKDVLDSYRDLMSGEEWASFFLKKLPLLDGNEEIVCCRLLSELFESSQDKTKAKHYRDRAEKINKYLSQAKIIVYE
jgi:hypothetical protein